jgi:hypothetical protein
MVLEAMQTDLGEIKDLLKGHLGCVVAGRPQRELSDDDAKAEVLALFGRADEGPLYYDEIADTLDLPLRQVVDICNSLEAGGVIGERS